MLPYGANRDLRRENVGTRHRGHSEYYVQRNVICIAFGRSKDFYFCSATSDTLVSSCQVVVGQDGCTEREKGESNNMEIGRAPLKKESAVK